MLRRPSVVFIATNRSHLALSFGKHWNAVVIARRFSGTTETQSSDPNSAPSSSSAGEEAPRGSILTLGMKVGAFGDATEPVAVGTITNRIADNVVVVTFEALPKASLVIELGSKVTVTVDSQGQPIVCPDEPHVHTPAGAALPVTPQPPTPSASTSTGNHTTPTGSTFTLTPPSSAPHLHHSKPHIPLTKTGLVAKVHGNGMFAILFDDDKFSPKVQRESILQSEGRPKFMATDRFKKMVDWVRLAGVEKKTDREATAAILFQRGWREDKMYLLEANDVHCLTHLNKSVRMGLLEKAEWERDRHRLQREINRERLKEKSDWRYWITRYSGVFSALIGVMGASSVFMWNYKRMYRDTRQYALDEAVERLWAPVERVTVRGHYLQRVEETNKVVRILKGMDIDHPRIVVMTGARGCGKSILVRQAARQITDRPILFVDLRAKEDPLTAIVKALQVSNMARCGDLLDFVADACTAAREQRSRSEEDRHVRVPIIIFKLHDDVELPVIHNVALALTCDRRVCHVAVEVDGEHVPFKHSLLDRLDFYHFGSFSKDEALSYLEHKIDPLSVLNYLDVVGTNATALDELMSAVHQRGMKPKQYLAVKLSLACREMKPLLQKGGETQRFLEAISDADFPEGLSAPPYLKHDSALDKYIHYNHETNRWVFSFKEYHTAVCVLKQSPTLFPSESRAKLVRSGFAQWFAWLFGIEGATEASTAEA